MKYELVVEMHSPKAQNKGTIRPPAGFKHLNVVKMEAANDNAAYDVLMKTFAPLDSRPLAGKSYLRQCRVIAQ